VSPRSPVQLAGAGLVACFLAAGCASSGAAGASRSEAPTVQAPAGAQSSRSATPADKGKAPPPAAAPAPSSSKSAGTQPSGSPNGQPAASTEGSTAIPPSGTPAAHPKDPPARAPADTPPPAAQQAPQVAPAAPLASDAARPSTSDGTAPSQTKTEAGAKPSTETAGLSAECAALFEEIQRLDKAVPVLFIDLTRPVEEIYADMLRCTDLSRTFLGKCGAAGQASSVKAIVARLELARLRRFREDVQKREPGISVQEVQRRYVEHVQGLKALAESAAKECGPGSDGRRTALRALLELNFELQRFDEGRATAETLLQEYPEYTGRPHVHTSVGQHLLEERKYTEAARYLEKVLHEHPQDLECVQYNDILLNALLGDGDLEGVEELMQLIRVEYPTRLAGLTESHYLRRQYEQWLCMAPFWIGFARMALGDDAGSKAIFREHIADADARARQMKDEEKPVANDPCNITVEFRSKDLLDFIENYKGWVPATDLDLGDLWATEEHITLREARGKVVAAMFRMPRDRKSASFLQGIDAMVKAQGQAGLAGVTLGYLSGQPDPAQDAVLLQRMRDDLALLKVSLPAGFEPDRQGHQFFRQVHAIVGTPSFVVFDRKGQIAWFLADPQDMYLAVARRVIERLLAEKP
jgi:tetratricopeptide (TPR) repeat protein